MRRNSCKLHTRKALSGVSVVSELAHVAGICNHLDGDGYEGYVTTHVTISEPVRGIRLPARRIEFFPARFKLTSPGVAFELGWDPRGRNC
jgi:hypothetical protein